MVVDFPFFVIPQGVHVGMKQDNDEGQEQVKQQPHIHHLHVGCLGQVVAHVDEHRS